MTKNIASYDDLALLKGGFFQKLQLVFQISTQKIF